MVLDLKELKEILEREVMQRMDHRHLNKEVPELKGQIPTCENIARVIWNLLDPKSRRENCTACGFTKIPISSPIVIATARERAYEQRDAAYRARTPLSFFRVAPPAQFQIERQRKQPRLRQVQQSVWPWPQLHRGIRVSGKINRDTGMISNLADLDKFVNEKVIEPFDHRSLNEEVAEFRNTVRQRKSFASKFLSA